MLLLHPLIAATIFLMLVEFLVCLSIGPRPSILSYGLEAVKIDMYRG